MEPDKRTSMIMECEEVVDEILHKYGCVFDHHKIRNKISELIHENLGGVFNHTNPKEGENVCHGFNQKDKELGKVLSVDEKLHIVKEVIDKRLKNYEKMRLTIPNQPSWKVVAIAHKEDELKELKEELFI